MVWGRITRRAPERRSSAFDEEFIRKLERLALVTRRTGGWLAGDHATRRQGSSLEFADHRNYAQGDDFRRVDWHVYGRLDELFLRLTEAKEAVTLHVLLDTSRSMDWGEPNKLGYARRIAAALAYVALASSDRVTVARLGTTVEQFMAPVQGKAHALGVLRFLDEPGNAAQTDLNAALDRYAMSRRGHGIAVLISDLLSPGGIEAGLRRLAGRGFDVLVLHVLAPGELTPELEGYLRLVDQETGETIEINPTGTVLAAYRRRLDDWLTDVQAICRRVGANYVQFETSMPFEDAFLHLLHRRRVLA